MEKILYLTFLLFLVSCGAEGMPWEEKTVKVQSIKSAEAELYSYEFNGSQCTTGLQEFQSLNDVCNGLLNEELNNNCQKNKRLHLYETNCL